jgi:hypothetical protein
MSVIRTPSMSFRRTAGAVELTMTGSLSPLSGARRLRSPRTASYLFRLALIRQGREYLQRLFESTTLPKSAGEQSASATAQRTLFCLSPRAPMRGSTARVSPI